MGQSFLKYIIFSGNQVAYSSDEKYLQIAAMFNCVKNVKGIVYCRLMETRLCNIFINGVGNYYCEAETRDLTRTDVIVDYHGQQFVVEMKIWRGESYNERGEKQLVEYLDYYHLTTGYMLSSCFNKSKQPGLREVNIDDRRIYEATVYDEVDTRATFKSYSCVLRIHTETLWPIRCLKAVLKVL